MRRQHINVLLALEDGGRARGSVANLAMHCLERHHQHYQSLQQALAAVTNTINAGYITHHGEFDHLRATSCGIALMTRERGKSPFWWA